MIKQLSMKIPRQNTTLRLSVEAMKLAKIACAMDEMSLTFYIDGLVRQDARRRKIAKTV